MQQTLWLILAVAAGDDPKVLEVGKGLKISGTLDKARPQQVYHVKLHEGGTYVIDMVSPKPKALDPLLRLLDATGKLLASDDDSGGGQNARLIFLAPATASYQVVATSSEGPGAGAYRLQIKRDDAREGDALERQVADLRRKGRYPEAIEAARALLAFRQRMQGAAHWQTTNARWTLRTLEKVNALSVSGRAEVAEAGKLSGSAVRLRQAGKHAQATPLDQKALDLRRKLLGEEHPDTALSYNNLALNLNFRGKYAAAAPLYEKALDLRRKLLGGGARRQGVISHCGRWSAGRAGGAAIRG
jgi:tetratricopeptide (TPR) repeat protein